MILCDMVQFENAPRMLFADQKGNIYDHPTLEMVGFPGDVPVRVDLSDLIPLPQLSKIFFLPKCKPIGFDPFERRYMTLHRARVGKKEIPCYGVSAFIEPGYGRTLLPAIDYADKDYILPLWAYTAVGWGKDGYVVAAFQVEYNPHWDPQAFDDRELIPQISRIMKRYPRNPLFRHLRHCATNYHCFAAKNLFFRRWEAPIPVSRWCNSKCLGCLSDQPSGSCPPAHERITFTPEPRHIVELAVDHLEEAEDPIVSFGQGCEGEPLLEHRLIAKSIRMIREKTFQGTINLNTNGSIPDWVDEIINSGLDSIRISLPSARPALYNAYCRPQGFCFEDVVKSISLCNEKGIYTMINYLIFPGISDQEDELKCLFELIRDTGIQFIHFKNLNIDPDLYIRMMPRGNSPCFGIRRLSNLIKEKFPHIEIGYYNRNLKAP